MESGARNSLVAEKISTVGCSMGKADEILGRIFDVGAFTILGQKQFVVIISDKICRMKGKISRKI
jgi:hypothetical protein